MPFQAEFLCDCGYGITCPRLEIFSQKSKKQYYFAENTALYKDNNLYRPDVFAPLNSP